MVKRRFPWWLLVIAFVLVPLIEIFTIIQIGSVIGAPWTIVLLIVASILGSWLVKREGSRAWKALQSALHSGRMPATELADAALILIGGTLMLTPGFLTDVVALVAILPFTRPFARTLLSKVVSRKLTASSYAGTGAWPGGAARPGGGPQTARRPGPEVVQGDVVE